MKKSLLGAGLSCTILLGTLSGFARQGTPPLSRQQKVQDLASVQQLVMPGTDKRAQLDADARIGVTTPLRFAVPETVHVTPTTHGTWEPVRGGRLWRLRVLSAGATDLNFGFSDCSLPDGATLHVYSEEEEYVQGPYNARDNKLHGQLWTPVLPGSRAVIELFVPADADREPQLVLSRINRGYRDMFRRQKDLSAEKAGSCNIDVICPAADPWRNEIRSVARYTVDGGSLCTGTLINNVNNDFRPYFLTADHCEITAGNAASVVVYWNYESPTCGQHGGGSLARNQSGATFRASKADVDFTLIELDDVPDSSFNVYYSGWDRSNVASVGAVGIHHPSGDEKSISFANSTLFTVDSCIGNGSSTHWQVTWNSGTTEPGSSGSGIWNPSTHLLMGILSGGDAACSAPNDPDCYGKFSVAWQSGSSASSRLRDWLDPASTGVTSVPGRDPNARPLIIAAGSALVSEGCTPTNGVIDPGESVTVSFSLQNFGASNAFALVATLLATNGVSSSSTQSYGLIAAGGAAVTRNFSFVATGACGSVISPTLQLQDGTNNLGTVSFMLRMGTPLVSITQNFDTVSVPALPSGWVNAASGLSTGWRTVSSPRHTPPNSVFAPDPADISDATLTSPSIPIATVFAQLSFAHSYEMEDGYDGGVLEIAYNNGPFNDIINAGGSFVSGGYNDTIAPDFNNPIADRDAWTGSSGGFITSTVNLPVTAAGQNIRLRWRLGSDESVGETGWNVDTISISDGYACCQQTVPLQIVDTLQMNNNFVFSFNTVAGQTYITEYQNVLATNLVWTPLRTNAGDGTKKSVTNSTGAAANRFFRVKVQ